jgi:tetratricopeptide (TPR) repeat protein
VYGATQENLKSEQIIVDSEVDDLVADQHLAKGDLDKAIALHKRLLTKNPSSGLTHYHLGYAYSLKGLYDEEIASYKKAIKLGYKKEGVYHNLGLAYVRLETDYKQAIRVFNKVIQINPKNAEAYFNLGLSHQYLGNYTKATKALLQAIKLDSSYLEAYNVLGVVYVLSGQPDKAEEAWTEILKRDPQNQIALFNLETLKRGDSEQKPTLPSQKVAQSDAKNSSE